MIPIVQVLGWRVRWRVPGWTVLIPWGMSLGSPRNPAQPNTAELWDAFDPDAYVEKNYRTVLWADEAIISIVRAHFSDHFRGNPSRRVRGIDVGAGANLYPAFTMLPWCDEITLLDRSRPNLRYLERQLDEHDSGWDAFWQQLCKDDSYAALSGGPWDRLGKVARVEQGDLFALDRPGQWEIGTMFFVAESLSTDLDVFKGGVKRFLEALAPGAPFAAAFMEHSEGYKVKHTEFPACDVDQSHIHQAVGAHAREFLIHRIDGPKVRTGYTSMILACGFR
ncbi:SCO2525 family SAM-dependent methyltransferase [Streptomyces sp. NPDC096132]|uniref:SCO2525 family SAM-dependent methyltransferase n=1 Tax=Streptomyces sp. NPDC096132 TaxID=3366075 RepID=UPI0037FB58A2